MKITGEILKTERLKQELRIQDIATSLKLSSKIIMAIETGDIDNLPPKTFVRGFVKNYAQLIKLDVDMVLRQFQEEMGSTNPLPKIAPPPPAPREKNIKGPRPALKQTAKDFSNKSQTVQSSILTQNENSKKVVLMVSVAIILIIFLVVSDKVVDNLNTNPVAVTTAEEKLLPTTTPAEEIKAELVTPPAPAESQPTHAANSTATSIDHTQAQAETIKTAPSDSKIGDATAPTTAKTPATATTPQPSTANTTVAPLPSNVPEAGFEKSNGKPVEILLEAKKDTELFYAKGDSKQFISLKLSAKQIQILRSNVGLYLKAADGGSFKISVNGVEKGFAAGEKKAVKLTF